MKWLSLLLALYISLLTAQPLVADVLMKGHKKESCCSHHKKDCSQKEKSKKGNCCSEGVCNPFNLCNCCCGYIPTSKVIIFNQQAADKFAGRSDRTTSSSYINECFHPPELSV